MKWFLRDFRLIPIVLVAITCLFVLKSLGLIFEGGYTLGKLAGNEPGSDITGTITNPSGDDPPSQPAMPLKISAPATHRSWAQEIFNYPDVTGSVGKSGGEKHPPPKTKAKAAKTKVAPAVPSGRKIPIEGGRMQSPAERAVLERLSERRGELDERARKIDMREKLLMAAEKRLEGRIAKLKQLEASINASVRAKDKAEAARFKNLITMYESMKPKDAARIFDRLDMSVLVEVATKINPRRMSEILAQMSPQVAERLTIELARRPKDNAPAQLPKISGRMSSK